MTSRSGEFITKLLAAVVASASAVKDLIEPHHNSSSIIGSVLPASYLAYFSIKNISLVGSQAHTRPRWKRSMFNEHNEQRFPSKSSGAKSRSFQIISHNLFFNLMFFFCCAYALCPSSRSPFPTLFRCCWWKNSINRRENLLRRSVAFCTGICLLEHLRRFFIQRRRKVLLSQWSFHVYSQSSKTKISQGREIAIYVDGSRTLFWSRTGDGIAKMRMRCCVDWSELLTAYEDLRSNVSRFFSSLVCWLSHPRIIQGKIRKTFSVSLQTQITPFRSLEITHPVSLTHLWKRL